MSLLEGLGGISEMLGDSIGAVDEGLAELEAAAVQSEDDDLYAGLQCDADNDDEGGTIVVRQQRQQIQELQAALAQKDQRIISLQEALAAKGDEVQQLASQRLVLLTNISSLFKTAQAEIKRHTTQLQSTRLELVQLKAQLARLQRQPAGQAKAPKQQQQQQQLLPPRQQQQLPLPPRQQQQQQLPQAMHDITSSCLNHQRNAVQQPQQKQERHQQPAHTPQQQQQQQQRHRCQTQQPGRQPGPGTASSCKRCRSSSPQRGAAADAAGAAAGDASHRHKQPKQHCDAVSKYSKDGSSRKSDSHGNGRQDCYSMPSNTSRGIDSSRAGGGSGSSGGYNNAYGGSGGSCRSRSPSRADGCRGSSRAAAAGSHKAAGHRANSPDRRQDRGRN